LNPLFFSLSQDNLLWDKELTAIWMRLQQKKQSHSYRKTETGDFIVKDKKAAS